MGCINSKKAIARASPAYVHSGSLTDNRSAIAEPPSRVQSGVLIIENKAEAPSEDRSRDGKKFRKNTSKGAGSFRISHRFVEAELNAAGWPPWLTSTAGEAVHGWVPLKAESYEKLDKIGQGTYSSVFRAREVETGRMVALKKVHIDSSQPESIRFMAREITILRRLDHPNIMKLEGIITSRLSSSLYLVFEYMEHDLAGLVSSPDIKFSETQVKCYMRQLFSGLEHCHIHGVMHRDIKTSNILVNNEGVLKIGDFGLANTLSANNRHPLTSCVVTLWYRPPELLMGSTNYGVSVDLWSVGCVFAELFLGKPILKGRTEVEQIHKIFKLCGSPPDEFWKKYKLPHATMFKPQTHYECTLREQCKDIPVTAVNLIETLLSVDPLKRGTASSALMSEYFSTKPYACDPSILPKYPPHKEMDAKIREDACRKKIGVKVQEAAKPRKQRRVRKILHEPTNLNKSASKQEEVQNVSQNAHKDHGKAHLPKEKGGAMHRGALKPSSNASTDTTRLMDVPHGFSVPVPVSGSNGFTWTKNRKLDAASTLSDGSRSKISALDPSFAKGTYDLTRRGTEVSDRKYNDHAGHHDETSNHQQQKHQVPHGQRDSFDAAEEYHYIDLSVDFDPSEQPDVLINSQDHRKQGELTELSGPLVSQSNNIDESLQRHENGISRSSCKSRLGRDK